MTADQCYAVGLILIAAGLAIGACWVWWHHRRPAPAHRGATVGYGAELRHMRTMAPAPELTTATETQVADHDALSGITTALVLFETNLGAALDLFLRGQPLTRMRIAVSGDATGELDLAELDALLDAEDLVGAS